MCKIKFRKKVELMGGAGAPAGKLKDYSNEFDNYLLRVFNQSINEKINKSNDPDSTNEENK